MSTRAVLLLLAAVALVGTVACTRAEDAARRTPAATASRTATATRVAPAVTPLPTSSPTTAPAGPWQVGEPIHLDAEPYAEAMVTEVTAEMVLPDRDTLDRDGGSFVWERASGRLLFIEGIQYLHLAPGLVDGRPIGVAFTPLGGSGPARSVIVRLDPFEAVVLPLALNVPDSQPGEVTGGAAELPISFWQSSEFRGRTLPAGDYRLDLETATLTLEREQRRAPSSERVVEESWLTGTSIGVAMVVQNGRRSLNHGAAGAGAEIVGPVDRWVLSPDGERLLMVANRSQLTVYELAADRLWTLGRPAEYGSAAWSPDGRYIAATVFDAFEDTTRALVFDAEDLERVAYPGFGVSPAEGLAMPPLEDAWAWRWRSATELFVGGESTLSLLDVESGEQRVLLDDRQSYDTFAWGAETSTLAHSRVHGAPVSILELDGSGGWHDIPLLAASPQVGLFDMNWGAEGQWLALNTAPGRS